MTEKWWIDPSYDPMQDLHNCKNIISEMAPALREHSMFIRDLVEQHRQLIEMIKEDRLEIALLTAEVKRQRAVLQMIETSPIMNLLITDSVK